MKSQVLVPNIILTTNPKLASQFSDLEKKYTTFSRFLEDVKDSFNDDQYFILTTDNGSITKFEFSIQGNQLKSSPPKCVIEFIQTGGTFEIELLQSYKRRIIASNGKRDFDSSIFYVAFGIGDDLSYWSTFQAVTLIGASVFQNFDNPKVIQLTFSPGAGYHMILDALDSSLSDDAILSRIELNNKQYRGFVHGPNPETELALTYRSDDFNINSDLITKYLLGFNAFDGFYKKVINGFFRALFGRSINVFFVSDDLFKLTFSQQKSRTRQALGIERTTWDKDHLGLFDIFSNNGFQIGNYKRNSLGRRFFETFKYDGLRNNFIFILENLSNLLLEYFSIETTIDINQYEGNGDPEILASLSFILEAEDDPDLSERKTKLKQFVETIKKGLNQLSGEQNIVLISESDVKLIEFFYDAISPEAKEHLPLAKGLPMIMIGEERIIRAMLYGETFTPHTTKAKPAEILPKNDRAAAYLNAEWLSKNLYGSQPTKEQASEFQKSIERSIGKELPADTINYGNFPIFRYNTPNPNVLGITVDDNKAFFSLLTVGFGLVENRVNELSINLDRKRGTEEAVEVLRTEEGRQFDEFVSELGKFKAEVKTDLRELLYDTISDRFLSEKPVYKDKLVADFKSNLPTQVWSLADPSETQSAIIDDQLFQASETLKDAVEYVLHSDKTFEMLQQIKLYSYFPTENPSLNSSMGGFFDAKLLDDKSIDIFDLLKKSSYSTKEPFGALDAVGDIRDLTGEYLGLDSPEASKTKKKRKNEIIASLIPIVANVPGIDMDGIGKFLLVYLTMLETLAVAEVAKAGGDNSKLSPEVKKLKSLFRKLSQRPELDTALGDDLIPVYEGVVNDLNITLKGIEDSLESTRLYNDLVRSLDSYTFTVDITTLPFFNICNFFWLGYPCLLYAKRPKLVGAVEEEVLDTLISGPYLIQGLRHVITPTTCESSFVLMKSQMDLK